MANHSKKTNQYVQRLATIEAAIRDIQDQMVETGRKIESLEGVKLEFEEMKKVNTRRRKRINLFGRFKKPEPEPPNPTAQVEQLLKSPLVQTMFNKFNKTGKEINLSEMATLLQEPMIKSMLGSSLLGSKGDANSLFGGKQKRGSTPGVSEIMSLLNNPAIKSVLKNLG